MPPALIIKGRSNSHFAHLTMRRCWVHQSWGRKSDFSLSELLSTERQVKVFKYSVGGGKVASKEFIDEVILSPGRIINLNSYGAQ